MTTAVQNSIKNSELAYCLHLLWEFFALWDTANKLAYMLWKLDLVSTRR